MSNENNKQDIQLAELSKDVKHIKEALDRQIESYNGKFRMTDDRITREVGANKTLIDLHCKRIREVEKEQAEMKTKQEVNKTKLGALILVISSACTFIANYVLQARH